LRSLSWYRDRLAAMSAAELTHRLRSTLRREARRLRAGRVTEGPPLLAEARRRMAAGPGRPIRFFDLGIDFPGEWPDWSKDYRGGARAPLRFYGDVDYRDEREVGDSKYTWELNRHQFLAPWALDWARTRDESAAAAIAAVVLDWIRANPRYRGINWGSALELSLRLISWGLAFEVGAEAPILAEARPLVLQSVAEQAAYVRHTLSAHSSANNHLLGELVGLLAAGVFFPDARRTRQHADHAATVFVDEMRRQNFPDGVNREQAVYYHHYALEYLVTGMRLLERLGRGVPADLPALARRMLSFVDATTDEAGRPMPIGDADDGVVTGLNLATDVSPFESLLWTGWVLFGDEACGAHAARIAASHGRPPVVDQRTAYWHGQPARALPPQATGNRRWVFPEGGYVVSRSEGITLVFRAGPFGYPSIAAHAHCDQLSVLLRLGQTTVLGDSGTGVYHTEDRWRRYFRGSSAHNTVRVDGLDQAEYAGPFLWRTHANGRLHVVREERDELDAVGTHDGYLRLPDPVTHERRVRLDRGESVWIDDSLVGEAAHRFELFWNLGPGIRLAEDEALAPAAPWAAGWRIVVADQVIGSLVVTCDRPARARRHCGDESIPAGFDSPRYFVFTPVEQLCVEAESSACRFSTLLRFGGVGPDGGGLRGRWN